MACITTIIKNFEFNEEAEVESKTEEILPGIKLLDERSNVDPLPDEQENDAEMPPSRKRRRVMPSSVQSVALDVSKAEDKMRTDSLKLFFDCMFSVTCNLPPKLQRTVKRSLFEAVMEAEELHENNEISEKKKSKKSGKKTNQQLNDSFAVEEDENDA